MKIRDAGVARGVPIIVCTMLLSGCALPVPIQIASWALDGISMLATQKSLTDHGISAVTQKDCALWRGLKGDDVCSEVDDVETIAIASAEQPRSVDNKLEPVASLASFETAVGVPEAAPVVVTNKVVVSERKVGRQRLMIAGKRIWSDSINADLYYVIGSFSDRNNARRMVGKHETLGPAVMASRLDGVEVYRVAVGPFTVDQKRDMKIRLKKAGIGNSWAMRIDHQDWQLASPRELLSPSQSIAEVPSVPKKVAPISEPQDTQEVAETPADKAAGTGQSSQLIDEGEKYLVIGSFSSADNANNYARSNARLSPRVLSAETAEGWRHRVIIGPYAKNENMDMRRRLASSGIKNVWALNLNPDDIISDTLLAEDTGETDLVDDGVASEIAEIPGVDSADDISRQEQVPAGLSDEMSWGVNLVKNIIDMFRSPDTTDVVGVVPALES